MDGVTVNEVTAGEVFEEEEAEVDKVSDVSCVSPLPLPLEEGENVAFPATPLGKKVVTEGREEGPNEGEGWRLAASRRRQRSIALEARHAELRTLAKDMNNYFLNPTREGHWKGRRMSDKSYYRIPPSMNGFKRWIKDSNVLKKDVDALTSEFRKYGVDEAMQNWLGNLMNCQLPHNRSLNFD